ncbi:hypothetical protein LXL04_026545 [Taraxacum kok-saghyz]
MGASGLLQRSSVSSRGGGEESGKEMGNKWGEGGQRLSLGGRGGRGFPDFEELSPRRRQNWQLHEQGSPQITPSSSPPPSPKTSTMSGESSNLATNLKDNLTIVTFPSALKLTSTNYLGWKTQVEALLQGLDLYRFIDGTHLALEPTTAPDGSKVPHTDCNNWFRHDRLLFGALVGSLSPPIIPLITNAASSLDAWKTLASTYASPSRGHIKQLQYRLKQLTKTSDQTITDYMQNVKTIVDELAILGKKMDAEDITDAVLHGLDQTMYKPTLDAIHARDSPISFNELHEKLINQELSLAQQITPTNIHQPASWCHQKGHSLNNCYTFKKVNPTISVPPYKKFQVKGAQVHMMTPQQISSSNGNWIFDSGATFHATNDLNNLSMHAPYDGTEELVIGDEFYSFVFVIKDLVTKTPLFKGTTTKGMYELRPTISPQISAMYSATSTTWHHRLGHPQNKVFQQLSSALSFNSSSHANCNSCQVNKSHRLPFHESSITSNAPLDILFSDVWCSPIESIDHYKYYIIFVDHFTKYIWLYPMKKKSESLAIFTRFHLLVEKFFNTKIKTFFSDNGGEFIKLQYHFSSSGISHLTSPPHTPQHNGYAERRHRHIVETAAYLINRLPTSTLHNLSPFSCLFQREPNYSKLKSFGCLCYPWLRPYSPHKLHPRSTPCIFVGYSPTQSAYYAYDPKTSKIYTSRHVVFVETDFPFNKLSSNIEPSPPVNLDDWLPLSVPVITPTDPTPSHPPSTPTHSNTSPTQSPTSDSYSAAPIHNFDIPQSPIQQHSDPDPSLTNSSAASTPSPPTKMTTRPHPKPNSKYYNSSFQLYIATTSPSSEPTNITQALKNPAWRNAMQDEFNALDRIKTWSLVPLSQAQNVVGCKWVYRTKYNPDGSVERLKARLVAKGFNQRPGIDYKETFSPVLKPATLRLILSLATSHNWSLRQLDINNAFLQGHLQEDVYMSQPLDLAWYDELKSHLLTLGFKPIISDSSLFILNTNSTYIIVLVYVHDIIVTGPSSTHVSKFISHLANKFSLKDLGSLSYFLGVEVLPHSRGILLSQRKYIHDILARANMSDCNPISTPMTSTAPLTLTGGDPHTSPTDYRALVGALQYLSLTRPDVAFTVNKLSQFMHAPTSLHWSALKRLLRYLHGTIHHGILIQRNSPLHLHAFSDADWVGDNDNYRSTTGYIVYLGANLISWSSKHQSTLARSSTEAEFRGVASTTTEIQWLTSLSHELNYKSQITPTIYCDNLSATSYSANPVFHSRMKHMALDFHFVREKVQQGTLRVQHIHGDDQLADALTKPLLRPRIKQYGFTGSWKRRPRIPEELKELSDLCSLLENTSLSVAEDAWRSRLDTDVWLKTVPLKVLSFIWRACMDRIPTTLNLSHQGVNIPSSPCALCTNGIDSSDHILASCPFTNEVLIWIFKWCDISYLPFSSVTDIIIYAANWGHCPKKRKRFSTIIYGALWCVWKARNDNIFNKKTSSPTKTADCIIYTVFDWVNSRGKMRNCSWTDWNDCDYAEFLEIGAENNGRLNVYVDQYEEPLFEWIQNEEPEVEDDDGQSEDDEDVKFNDGIKCDHQEDDEVISIRRTVNDHFLSKLCPVEVEARLDEDEQSNVDQPPIYPRHDDIQPWDKMIPELGKQFASPVELKELISNYAVANGYYLWYEKNDKGRLLVKCCKGKLPKCPFRLYTTWMKEEKTFQIKSLINDHNCSRAFKLGSVVTYKWIGKQLLNDILEKPKLSIRKMKAMVSKKYNINVSFGLCRNAKKYALTLIEGNLVEHYAKLWDYGSEIRRSNPGAHVEISVQPTADGNNVVFEKMYVSFKGVVDGWLSGCRKVIGLDGCFLKCICRGQLLSAIGRDGNNQIYPIAWATVNVESKVTWKWFIDKLMEDIEGGTGHGITLLSDGHKGILESVKERVPDAEHRLCTRHILANFVKKHYVAECFSKTAYLNTYAHAIRPMNDSSLWPTNPDLFKILPPTKRRLPGRPCVKRKRDAVENQMTGRHTVSRRGIAQRCTLCHETGHNKAKCPKKPSGSTSRTNQTPVHEEEVELEVELDAEVEAELDAEEDVEVVMEEEAAMQDDAVMEDDDAMEDDAALEEEAIRQEEPELEEEAVRQEEAAMQEEAALEDIAVRQEEAGMQEEAVMVEEPALQEEPALEEEPVMRRRRRPSERITLKKLGKRVVTKDGRGCTRDKPFFEMQVRLGIPQLHITWFGWEEDEPEADMFFAK